MLAAIYPGFVVQLQPDWLWFLRITPIGTDHVRIAWQVAVAPDVLEGWSDRDREIGRLLDLVAQVNEEDRPIVEGIRRNARSPQFDRAPFSHLERNVHDFDQYVLSRLTS